jgi:hypothetical protein
MESQESRVWLFFSNGVPLSVDVRGLWVDVRETLPGMEEPSVVDKLLATVVTRAKHARRALESAA